MSHSYHGHTLNIYHGTVMLSERKYRPTQMLRDRARNDLHVMTMDEAVDLNTRHYLRTLLDGDCDML